MTRKFDDLIYYKEDIIEQYASKRKFLDKKDVEDLLRCALLFLEKEAKNTELSSIEIPNVGFLHKKIDLSNIKNSKKVTVQDNLIAESAYIETTYLPIAMRRDMLDTYYPGLHKKDIQLIQNSK